MGWGQGAGAGAGAAGLARAGPLLSLRGAVLPEGPEAEEDGLLGHQDEVELGAHVLQLLELHLEVLQELRERERRLGRGCLPYSGQQCEVLRPQPRRNTPPGPGLELGPLP